ncbi:MAG: sensor histidine kinase, partial [Endomicrobiia bacterium]
EIEQNLPSIDADPERLKQVITNLVGNALKFTDPGATITIKSRLVTEKVLSKGYRHPIQNAAGKYVEISVIDTGWGIPENELDKIFEKFYQVGGTTPKKPKGTGLGLSIAAEIVKFHDGEIGVESVLGKGTTFKFVIPVFRAK